MDLISVIVPIYKVEPYLDRCVESIVAQTYENLQIILVDDGSPDRCPAMCDAWAAKDSRIQVIHKENGGLSDARNAGLAAATGEYVAFIDSDDSIAPDFIQRLFDALINSGADIAECATDYVDEAGNVLRRRNAADVSCMGREEALRRLVLEDGVYQTVWNKLYRRDVIAGILFEKGKYNEDEFWTYRIFDRMEKLAVVREPLYYYLQRFGSIIGVGYNIRRLDGLEARYMRMIELQKYESLACLTRQNLLMDCLWHYQSASRVLEGAEKISAQERILKIAKAIPPVPRTQQTGKLTHKIWRAMFVIWPNLTAWIRNRLGIGI